MQDSIAASKIPTKQLKLVFSTICVQTYIYTYPFLKGYVLTIWKYVAKLISDNGKMSDSSSRTNISHS